MKKEVFEIDLDLVKSAQEGSSDDFKKLLIKYDPLIKNLSNQFLYKYKQIPLEREDINNILSKSFWDLTLKYNEDYKKSFPAYIKQFLTWAGHEHMRSFINNKMKTMNYAKLRSEESQSNFKYEPSKSIDLDVFKNDLSKEELNILKLIANGFSVDEISKLLNKTKSYVYSLKYRSLKKTKNLKEAISHLI